MPQGRRHCGEAAWRGQILSSNRASGELRFRFGRVLWLNVLANFWVAVVLAVAPCYEATEVIWMNR